MATIALPPPGRLRLEAEAGHTLDPARGRRFLDEIGITWVIVHGALLTPAQRAGLDRPLPHLELVETLGEDRLFRVRERAARAENVVARLLPSAASR